MNPAPVSLKRIIVTLDSAVYSHAILDMALSLAASLHAEVEGVFVEDLNLVNLSALPFLREIKAGTMVETAINTEQMLRDMKAQARQAEQVLLQRAALRGISCTFRTWRGHATLEALRSNFEMDFLRLTQAPHYRHGGPAGSTVIDRICVLPGDAILKDNALLAARQFSTALHVPVKVLLPVELCGQIDIDQTLRLMPDPDSHVFDYECYSDICSLSEILAAFGRSVLVVSSRSLLFEEPGLSRFLDKSGLPVLMLRQT